MGKGSTDRHISSEVTRTQTAYTCRCWHESDFHRTFAENPYLTSQHFAINHITCTRSMLHSFKKKKKKSNPPMAERGHFTEAGVSLQTLPTNLIYRGFTKQLHNLRNMKQVQFYECVSPNITGFKNHQCRHLRWT